MTKQCIVNTANCCLQAPLSDGHLHFLNLTEPLGMLKPSYKGHMLSKGHPLLQRQHHASTSTAISTAICDRQPV